MPGPLRAKARPLDPQTRENPTRLALPLAATAATTAPALAVVGATARAHDVPLTTAAGALAPLTGPWGLAIATVAVIVIVVAYTRRTR